MRLVGWEVRLDADHDLGRIGSVGPSGHRHEEAQMAFRRLQVLGVQRYCLGKDLLRLFQPLEVLQHRADLQPGLLALHVRAQRLLVVLDRCILLAGAPQRSGLPKIGIVGCRVHLQRGIVYGGCVLPSLRFDHDAALDEEHISVPVALGNDLIERRDRFVEPFGM